MTPRRTMLFARALPACFAALLTIAAAAPARGQALGFQPQGNAPIEVVATDGVEWDRETQKYVARGKARVTQGGLSVTADVLTAYYRTVATGGNEIFRIDAVGKVKIASANETATGDRATFDVKGGILLMTGEKIELVTPQETVTARDSLEYNVGRNLAIARGSAHSGRGAQHLYADELQAHFRATGAAGGKTSDIERVEAIGNVVIVTPAEVVQAARGDYDPTKGLVHLTGQVKLTRDTTQINGEEAEVNLNTGVSKIIGTARVALAGKAVAPPAGGVATAPVPPAGDQRVRALITPKSKPQVPGAR
ncbi:MAG: hypothetical protein EXQ88_05275 [Alphaproteobacteria bacterium]|nr:hypothetical protein [Alphaproteobacteria bacterium]